MDRHMGTGNAEIKVLSAENRHMGAGNAEIKVLSAENPEVAEAPSLKAWSTG